MGTSEHFANVMVERLIHAVKQGRDVVPVVADSTSTAKIAPFISEFPDRLVNVGIAEQALVGTAAGLALGGKIAVTCNAAPFLVSRANEQVKVDVCYNNTNVKLMGLNAGASYGPLASTHHSIDDIAVMRGFGNIEIYAPASPNQCRQIIDYAIEKEGPVYVRLDGKALPEVFPDDYRFVPGKIDVLEDGSDIALVAMGSTVHEIVQAAVLLGQEGIRPKIIAISSVRPCDTAELARQLKGITHVISVEEHNVNGGVGSLVAETIAEHGLSCRLTRRGIADGTYALAADRVALRTHHGIDAQSVASAARKLIEEA